MQHVPPLFRRLDDFQIAYFWKNSRGVYLAINETGAKMIGSTVAKVVGQTDFSFFEETSAKMMSERDANILSSKKFSSYDSVAQTQGKWVRFRSCKVAIESTLIRELSLIGISAEVPSLNNELRNRCLDEAKSALLANPQEFLNSMLRHLAGVTLAYPRALGDILQPLPRV